MKIKLYSKYFAALGLITHNRFSSCSSVMNVSSSSSSVLQHQSVESVQSVYGNPLPKALHIQLVDNEENNQLIQRVIIIGDVHGCLDELKLLLKKCQYDSLVDTLVFVGDLVNKGNF